MGEFLKQWWKKLLEWIAGLKREMVGDGNKEKIHGQQKKKEPKAEKLQSPPKTPKEAHPENEFGKVVAAVLSAIKNVFGWAAGKVWSLIKLICQFWRLWPIWFETYGSAAKTFTGAKEGFWYLHLIFFPLLPIRTTYKGAVLEVIDILKLALAGGGLVLVGNVPYDITQSPLPWMPLERYIYACIALAAMVMVSRFDRVTTIWESPLYALGLIISLVELRMRVMISSDHALINLLYLDGFALIASFLSTFLYLLVFEPLLTARGVTKRKTITQEMQAVEVEKPEAVHPVLKSIDLGGVVDPEKKTEQGPVVVVGVNGDGKGENVPAEEVRKKMAMA